MSEMEMMETEDMVEEVASPVENNSEDKMASEEMAMPAKSNLSIEEGDIFVQSDMAVMLNILGITQVVGADPIYKVRLMATHLVPFFLGEVQLFEYIANKELMKLDSYRDFVEATTESLVFSEGEVYTQNGSEFLKIISIPFVYRGDDEIAREVIGVELSKSGTVELRNIDEVKALVYGNSDQFANMRGE
ncbi:MAG: hypothetical protein PHQ22_09615 [Sulfuricurvum sp.]|nr:hypothetical protein [Sulfuricurvum sp.]MDD5387436.1 hypothetical protein [Sulfuricurvum sp.]